MKKQGIPRVGDLVYYSHPSGLIIEAKVLELVSDDQGVYAKTEIVRHLAMGEQPPVEPTPWPGSSQ